MNLDSQSLKLLKIFQPKRQENSKESQDPHLDNLAEFLDGFDDDELENFLRDAII